MRAKYLPTLQVSELYSLTGADHHHLAHVVRVELREEVLLINGKGLVVKARVDAISKKEVRLTHITQEIKDLPFYFDLILGMPKRDALELSLKEATEIGFRRIILVRSQYSQVKNLDEERIQNLLVSALEQSNAPFLPAVSFEGWDEIHWSEYSAITLLDSQTRNLLEVPKKQNQESSYALVVGPEGGFASEELEYLHKLSNLQTVCLPTPIMRTPTAVAVGAGLLLKSLLD